MTTLKKVWLIVYGWIWILLVLTWPVVKWILSLITFYHFLRMIYLWDTPGANAWIYFILYFVVLTVFTTVVSSKPKKIQF